MAGSSSLDAIDTIDTEIVEDIEPDADEIDADDEIRVEATGVVSVFCYRDG